MYSPARRGGRNFCFCSSVPTWRIVLPTMIEFPRPSSGTPARRSSSFRAVISYGSRPWPPYSAGQDARRSSVSPPWRGAGPSRGPCPSRPRASIMSSLTCSAMKALTSSRKASLLVPSRKSIYPSPTGPNSVSARCCTRDRADRRPPAARPWPGGSTARCRTRHVPVPAVDVEPHARRLLGGPGREQEGHAGQRRELVGGVDRRPGRLAGQQAGAVDGGRGVGQIPGDRLERADRDAELLAALGVGDADAEGGGRQADEGAGGEDPPLVERHGVGSRGGGAGGEAVTLAGPQRTVGDGPGPEIGGARPSGGETAATSSSPSSPTTTSATAPAGTRRTVPSTAGRSARAPIAGGAAAIDSRRADAPAAPGPVAAAAGRRGQQPGGHRRLDEGHGRQRGAELLGEELHVEQRGAPAAVGFGHPHHRSPELAQLGPQLGVEAERFGLADPARRCLLGEERLEGGDQLLLVVAQAQLHGRPGSFPPEVGPAPAASWRSADTPTELSRRQTDRRRHLRSGAPGRRRRGRSTSVVNRYWTTAGPDDGRARADDSPS